MEIISRVFHDGDEWCIEVVVRTEVALREGVKKRKAKNVFTLCECKTREEAELDAPIFIEKARKLAAFW